jgi:hypothetical protein
MEYLCPTCHQVFQAEAEICPHLLSFFASLHGKKVWRIRYLHRYAYEFLSDEQFQAMVNEKPLIVSEAMCVEDFNAATCTGVNSIGKIVSIFG